MARHRLASFIAACGLAFAATSVSAAPVNFSVTASTFLVGTGYGIDADESAGNADLLDVRFAATGLNHSFVLNNPGDSQTFNFGLISLQESGFILPAEGNSLGVAAVFNFSDPLSGLHAVTATGTATIGLVGDAGVDYEIDWDPITVNFGDNGLFSINLADLSFTEDARLVQTATIRLLRAPNVVPEPTTLLLTTLGLAAMGASLRRRKSA